MVMDRFRRDDMKKMSKFDGLSPGTQRVLKRAAKGSANLTPAQAAEIGIDDGWLLVGTTQVGISGLRAYRL